MKTTSTLPILSRGDRVSTHLNETGTVTGPHLIHSDWYHVRIDGAYDKQVPPRWQGELVEVYRRTELSQPPKGHMPWSALKSDDRLTIRGVFNHMTEDMLAAHLWSHVEFKGNGWRWVATPQEGKI